MKRSGKRDGQGEKFAKSASPKADSRAVVVNKTQAQVDELSLITRQATGTQSHDVADRIIEQVTGVHVWPRPKDASDQVVFYHQTAGWRSSTPSFPVGWPQDAYPDPAPEHLHLTIRHRGQFSSRRTPVI